MNTDIRLSVDFWSHPKTVKLKRRLGLEGPVALQILWSWAARDRPDGDLSGMDDEDIEIAAGWDGEEGKLVSALVDLRWLDKSETGYVLHDWKEHNDYAANSKGREDYGRLMRLVQLAPEAAAELISQGAEGVSKEDYKAIMKSQHKGTPRHKQSTPQGGPQGIATGTPGVTPAPVPVPIPVQEQKNPTPPTPPSRGGVREPEGPAPAAGEGRTVYTPEFEAFWAAYPRKVEKKPAFKAWLGVVGHGVDPGDVTRAAEVYAKAALRRDTPPDKLKHPATFLHEERWRDWLPPDGPSYLEAVRLARNPARGRDSPTRPEIPRTYEAAEAMYGKHAGAIEVEAVEVTANDTRTGLRALC